MLTPASVAPEDDDEPPEPPTPSRWRTLRRTVLSLVLLALLGAVAWVAAGRPDLVALVQSTVKDISERAPTAQAALSAVAEGDAPPTNATSAAGDGAPVKHEGYVPLEGGLLVTPKTFVPDGSDYDLLIHFHGDVGMVRESAELAGLNAAVAIINLGVGSDVYRKTYSATATYETLLAEIQRAVAKRGLIKPRLRRVALSSWSAGYGALGAILRSRKGDDPLDALIVLDGIHTSWSGRDRKGLNTRPLKIFVKAAEDAAAGRILFTITHSMIDPVDYVGTKLTARHLLRAVGAEPVTSPMLRLPDHIELAAAAQASDARRGTRMVPVSDTRVGDLRVRGYGGNTQDHHAAHLLQMSATALPDLVARWK